jgi:two-component system NtrC family sensor kinase
MSSPPQDLSSRGGGRWIHGRLLHGVAPLTVGLAVTAAVMAGACTVQARDASRSSAEAAKEMRLSQAYQDINSAANREYSAQLRYLSADRRSPSTGTPAGAGVGQVQMARFAQAQADLRAAVERVNALGSVDDKSLASFVKVEDRQYSQNARTVFAAVESGQITEAQHLATTITGPRVDALISLVASAAATHDRRSQQTMARLTAHSRLAALAIPASFAVALLLLGGCWVILLQLNKAVRYQASALLDEKQLLSTVIESSPYFVYWKDPAGRFLGANRAFERLSSTSASLRSPENLAGTAEPVTDAGNPDLIRRLTELERQVQEAGAAALDQQATVQSPGGEERRLLFSILPRQGPRGPEGVIGVGVDVTLLTDLERQLATASRLESVGRLAAGLAHEINTPVQVLTLNTQFIADTTEEILAGLGKIHRLSGDQDLDPAPIRALIDDLDVDYLRSEIPRALAESHDDLQRVAGIVRAMKDFADGGQGRGPCRLNDAVQSVVEISRHEWTSVADLSLSLDPGLGTVMCHQGEIKESLLAIIMNASHAVADRATTHSGAPRGVIEVTTHALPGAARITVRDNGIGMDDDVRGKIFDPFFTTKAVGRGTGQGLNFAYGAIVVHHGGSIDVSSTPGEGSTFTITLPTGDPEAEASASRPISAEIHT